MNERWLLSGLGSDSGKAELQFGCSCTSRTPCVLSSHGLAQAQLCRCCKLWQLLPWHPDNCMPFPTWFQPCSSSPFIGWKEQGTWRISQLVGGVRTGVSSRAVGVPDQITTAADQAASRGCSALIAGCGKSCNITSYLSHDPHACKCHTHNLIACVCMATLPPMIQFVALQVLMTHLRCTSLCGSRVAPSCRTLNLPAKNARLPIAIGNQSGVCHCGI